MKAFVWDQRFVTEIESVDKQHCRLVDIVNELGNILLDAAHTPPEEIERIFKRLADYARFHFTDEERVMSESGVDARHADPHKRHHANFIQQVRSMWGSRESTNNPAEILHGFLSAWLTYHILGEDQMMARQIKRIQAGATPAAAFDTEAQAVDNSTSALLDALHSLYRVLAVQNRGLANVNAGLEEKVAARTSELALSNSQLQREQDELRRLLEKVEHTQNQLLQAEKMASIGQLAAGVAHEINNPIGFVNSNLGTLRDYVDRLIALVDACKRGEATDDHFKAADYDYLRSDIGDLFRESQDGLGRVKKIVADLKDFSHVDEAEWQDADLNAGLESTLNVVWNELKYKAKVVRELGTLPRVPCIPAQINQVVMNLLVNAAQAIETQGVITLRSGADGESVWVEVADTGKGMTPEVQKRIFEPFFTTKPVGKGTGLGLSLSYGIINKHHGRIDVQSAVGKGTTFRVTLPLTQAEPALAAA